MISFFNFFSALCCASILCYFAYDNYNEDGWINFLNEIENTFLRFIAKFWLTAILGSGFIFFLVKGLWQFVEG